MDKTTGVLSIDYPTIKTIFSCCAALNDKRHKNIIYINVIYINSNY